MTDLAEAMADKSHLEPFDGLPVQSSGVEIPGAAGGLRDPLKVEPRAFHVGDRGYIVLGYVVDKVRFDPIRADKDEDPVGLRRVGVFRVESASFLAGEAMDLARDAIAETQRKVKLAQEAANGIGRIPYDDELQQAHADGLHASGQVPGCVECEKEADAAEAEAAEESAGAPDQAPGGNGDVDAELGGSGTKSPQESPPATPTPISGRRRRASAEAK